MIPIQNLSLDLTPFPRTAEYFRVNRLFNTRVGNLAIESVSSPSDAFKILRKIHREQGPYAYITNRIRERIAILILRSITRTTVFPSSIVNDVLYHTDAILHIEPHYFSVDFTENFQAIEDKMRLADSEGKIELISPSGSLTKLPFLVVYISDMLVEKIGNILERVLEDPSQSHDIAFLERVVSRSVGETFAGDNRSDLLFQVHTRGVLAEFIDTFLSKELLRLQSSDELSQ